MDDEQYKLHCHPLYELLQKCQTNKQRKEIAELLGSVRRVVFNDISVEDIPKIDRLLGDPDLFYDFIACTPVSFINVSEELKHGEFSDDDKLILITTASYKCRIDVINLILQTINTEQCRNKAIEIITHNSSKSNFEPILSKWEREKAANAPLMHNYDGITVSVVSSGQQHHNVIAKPTEIITPKTVDSKKNESEALCVICMENPSSRACVPCGHMCICEKCQIRCSRTNVCPICRVHIERIIKIYI